MLHIKYLLVILFLFFRFNSESRCTGDIYVWPSVKKIPLNSCFVIEKGYRMIEGKLVDGVIHPKDSIHLANFASRFVARLISRHDTIILEQKEYFYNSLGLEQVVLKPQRELLPSTNYTLVVEGLAVRLVKKNAQNDLPVWQTENKSDFSYPILFKKSHEKKQIRGIEEGGFEFFLIKYSIKIKDQSECLLKVRIHPLKSDLKIQEILIFTQKAGFNLDHNECHQLFFPMIREDYIFSYEIIDCSWNVNPQEFSTILKPLLR